MPSKKSNDSIKYTLEKGRKTPSLLIENYTDDYYLQVQLHKKVENWKATTTIITTTLPQLLLYQQSNIWRASEREEAKRTSMHTTQNLRVFLAKSVSQQNTWAFFYFYRIPFDLFIPHLGSA